MTDAERVIIDTDPGVDDLLAILLALRSPELCVEMLTTSGGNCSVGDSTRNALRTVELAGRTDVPVYRGSARPLRGRYRFAPYFHGPRGLTGRLPEPRCRAERVDAIEALARRLCNGGPPATLIALGPLTNAARLLTSRPECGNGISTLIVMGGALDAPGNVTRFAEFNTWNDPEAAEAVFRSGVATKLISLDVCNMVGLSRGYAADIPGPVGRVTRGWFGIHEETDSMPMADVLAVAAACKPGFFTYERTPVEVAMTGEERGRTSRGRHGPLVDVAVQVDAAGVLELFFERVAAGPREGV